LATEWEHIAAARAVENANTVVGGNSGSGSGSGLPGKFSNFTRNVKATSLSTFNRILPPEKKFTKLQLTRQTLLITITVIILAILALIIGLAAGLQHKSYVHHSTSSLLRLTSNSSRTHNDRPTSAGAFQGQATTYDPSIGALNPLPSDSPEPLLTFPRTGAGACGRVYQQSDYVCALNYVQFAVGGGADPNNNPNCGKSIHVCLKDSGHCIDVKVVDRCPTCGGSGGLDLSLHAFKDLTGGQETGRFPISWEFA
jgi:hypothetical protein